MMSSQLKLLKGAMPADDETPDEVLVTRAQRGDRVGARAARPPASAERCSRSACAMSAMSTRRPTSCSARSSARWPRLVTCATRRYFAPGCFASALTSRSTTCATTPASSPTTGEDERPSDPDRPLTPPALERIEAAESSAALRDAVRTLPTKQRMTLELRIYEDLPFREIAAALDISEGAAKVNFHYAVRKLRASLGPEPDGASRRGRGR